MAKAPDQLGPRVGMEVPQRVVPVHAGTMGDQITHRYGPGSGQPPKPKLGQIPAGRRVPIERAGLGQPGERDDGERLGDRADGEQRPGCRREIALDIARAMDPG